MVRETKSSLQGGVECYPLSPMQQGMLFHHFNHVRGVDIEQVIGELHEEIEPERFEQAWNRVVARHDALRTTFEWQEGAEPRQIVHPASRVRIVVHHGEFGSEREARRGLEEYLAADRREGFLALRAPLLRVALLRGGPAHFWFVTTYHHLLLDARSMTVMFREALDTYDALGQGRLLDLPPPPPYRAYIDWLSTLDLAAAEAFWRRHLEGFSTPTLVPALRTTGADESEREPVGELAFRLGEAATTALRAAATKHEVTLNTMVQAAWAIVLGRYSGEDDVVFGALRAGRSIPIEDAASIIGLFINTVPVRVRVPAQSPIGALLRELRRQWIALREHEHTPLMKIQQWSDVAPGQRLFETILSYQEPSWDAALTALGGPWASRSFEIRAQPNYPLALEVLAGTTLTVKFIHERAHFPDEAVARLAGHVRTVLEALAEDRIETVGALPLLTSYERHQMLVTWNNTGVSYPREQCVHTWVEMQAHRAPDGIAVADAANALTYGELNTRANRLAHRLKTLGVGPDVLVAVCMERSTEMLVAWLGVLKAGGAFVPLDPGYPRDRLAFQIADSGARVLITQPKLRQVLPADLANITVLDVGAGGRGFESEPAGNLPDGATSQHLAYVIYTSGSTGRPKGVEIEHRALMNLVTWHQRTYAVTAADRAMHLASPAFDASVWETWPYLAAGASVHIPDEETRISPGRLWQWMADTRVSIAFMPTPLAEAAMNEPWPIGMVLRALLTGGDTLKRRPPKNLPCALINHYGPTESTVVATCAVIAPVGPADAMLPIGRPVANTQAFVLDREMRPVPVGVAGELFIGGESLARGYLRRPDLTAEKFLPHPFTAARGARVYRTGDLVRWTAEGDLEFIGRVDHQVKVRGCRVELGEVEAVIHQHPSARESIVVARADERGQTQLAAYVLPRTGAGSNLGAELTEFLRAKLPGYMVPAAVVVLDAWPLTPNGKIDRSALPAPVARPNGASPASSVPPRTPVEENVAKIWRDVLRCPAVGVHDNFFELGGHSLLAAQVVSRLNTVLSGAVSVRTLFDQPVLADFAREVERHIESPRTPPPALSRAKRRLGRPEVELVQPT